MKFKEYFLKKAPKELAITGRIQDWLGDTTSTRLPASCTVFSVEDSMEGRDGIEDSWTFTSHGLRYAAGVAVDLSKLRPSGSDNGRGLVASGACSFAKFYSLLNQELRRGGAYKNGAVTLFLDYDHPDCEDFINMSSAELPWAKKAVYVDEGIKSHPIKNTLAKAVNNGKVWLAKKRWDDEGNRLYSNVCLEVLLPSRGTCMLSSVNLGIVENVEELPRIFTECMRWLCELHAVTGMGQHGHYLPPEEDKQVGLGVIGLANLLAKHSVTYKQFEFALSDLLDDGQDVDPTYFRYVPVKAYKLASCIISGYFAAANEAKLYGMKRAFAIAPTASMSYRYKDVDGYTTAPEISPPIAHLVDRDSETFGVQTYRYHPNSELAKNVGWSVQWRLLNTWQRLQDATDLGHAISANIWSSKRVTPEFIDEFIDSDLVTTYYRISVDQEALDKSEVVTPDSSDDKLRGLYDDNTDPFGDDDDLFGSLSDDITDDPEFLTSPEHDDQYCNSCGG